MRIDIDYDVVCRFCFAGVMYLFLITVIMFCCFIICVSTFRLGDELKYFVRCQGYIQKGCFNFESSGRVEGGDRAH